MNTLGTNSALGLLVDCRGVSSTNTVILIFVAALSMPAFDALGDGLADNISGSSSAGVPSGRGPSSAAAPFDSEGWGESGNWGGGDGNAFTHLRPGRDLGEGVDLPPPDSYTGSLTELGPVAGGPGGESSANGGSAPGVGPTYAEAPSGGSGSNSRIGSVWDAVTRNVRGGDGNGNDDTGSSSGTESDYNGFYDTVISAAYGSGTGTAAGAVVPGASVPSEPGEGVTGEGRMDTEQALGILLDNYGHLGTDMSFAQLERGVPKTVSLDALIAAAQGADADLAAAAEHVLSDPALLEALTGGSRSLSEASLTALSDKVDNLGSRNPWMTNGSVQLDAESIALVINGSADGNPPDWAVNRAYVLAANYDLLMTATTPGADGEVPTMRDTVEAIGEMELPEEFDAYLNERGINPGDFEFDFAELSIASRDAVNTGLYEFLDAPPGSGAEINENVGRETLLFFVYESSRDGQSWAEFTDTDDALTSPSSELLNEDGADTFQGEAVFYQAADEAAQLFAEVASTVDPRFAMINGVDPSELTRPDLSASDITQGALGDCYFTATIASYAESHPEVIERAIRDNRDGTFTATFYEADGTAVTIEVDNEIVASPYANGGLLTQADVVTYGAILEKAYSEFLNGRNGYEDDYEAIAGGRDAIVHQQLTGVEAQSLWLSEDTSGGLVDGAGNVSFTVAEGESMTAQINTDVASVRTQMQTWQREGQAITAGTLGYENDAIENNNLTAGHAYTVLSAEEDGVELRDPRGDEFNVTVSYEDFVEAFGSVSSANI